MSTITLSEAKTLVGDRDCHIGDFLYMDLDVALPTSLGNVIGIGSKVESAKRDAKNPSSYNKRRTRYQLFRVVSG
jgi:hypothetical protein